MQLTTEQVSLFNGGQIEIQNDIEGYLYRGEIATAVVEDDTFKVKLAWMAKGVFTNFPMVEHWVKDDNLDYEASLDIYRASSLGTGSEGGDRLCLQSHIVHELVVLYPPDGSKLDPAKVEGLELLSA